MNHGDLPYGWGIYIIEGVNHKLVAELLALSLLFIVLLTISWTTLKADVQGGMGIGQFALAFIALVLTTVAVSHHSLQNISYS